MCLNMLRAYGVTAVLNAAQGEMSDWNYINTKASYYSRDNIRFLGVPAFDSKTYPISQHFEEASHFIDEEIRLRKGNVCSMHSAQIWLLQGFGLQSI